MAAASLGLVLAALPVFLVGGLAVQVRQELGFGETALGATITAFFVAAGLASIPGGRLSDALGPRRSIRVGTLLTAAALLLLAVAAGWAGVLAALALAGAALGLTEPGIAMLLARLLPPERQGLAFGVKEAAIPGATLLAGAAVPAVALTIGWRWAFGLAPALVPLLWALVPDTPGDKAGGREGTLVAVPAVEASRAHADPPVGPLAVVAAGAGLGVAAMTAMGAFLVEALVAAGVPFGRAGLMLSAGSLTGIAGRVAVGWLADRRPKPQLPVVAVMLAVGAGALAVLAAAGSLGSSEGLAFLVVGALLAFSVGWAWTGLLFLSAVRASPASPGGAAGIALAGLSVGGAIGPLLFGVLVSAASFEAAWAAGAMATLAGAALVLTGDRLLARRAGARAQA